MSRAEIKIAALIFEHSLPMKVCDHLIPFLKDIFPHPNIAQRLQMRRTKGTDVINHILPESDFGELNAELNAKKFIMLVDDST